MRLHHNPISTCSQKVRLALTEKGLEVEVALLDLQAGDQLDPANLQFNPNAVVAAFRGIGRELRATYSNTTLARTLP